MPTTTPAQSLSLRAATWIAARVFDALPPQSWDSSPWFNQYTGQGGDRDPLQLEDVSLGMQPLALDQLAVLVRKSGLARRVCSLLPSSATSKGAKSWMVLDKTRDPAPWAVEAEQIGLARAICEAGTMANQTGNAAIWMRCEESGYTRDTRMPLIPSQVSRLNALVVVAKPDLMPDLAGPIDLQGQPTQYRLQVGVQSFTVHASRLLLFRAGPPPPTGSFPTGGWGSDSLLESCRGSLALLNSSRRGRARVFDRLFVWVVKTALPGANTDQERIGKIQSRWAVMRLLTHLGVALIAKEEEMSQYNAPTAGLRDLSAEAYADLAADTGYPVDVLRTEESRAGTISINSTGSSSAWPAIVEQYQAYELTGILRQFYDILYAMNSPVGSVPDYSLVFAPIQQEGAEKKAARRKALLEGDKLLIEMQAATPEQISRSRAGPRGFQEELSPPTAGGVVEPGSGSPPSV